MNAAAKEKLTGVPWTKYVENYSDDALTFIEVRDQSFTGDKKQYRCRICHDVRKLTNGAYNVKKQLSTVYSLSNNIDVCDVWKTKQSR